MPTTPYAKLRVSVNGGAPQTGGVVAPASATAQFSFESTVGWTKYRLALIGPSAWTLPAGWTNEAGTYVYTGVDTPPPALTLPSIATWGKFMATLTVNDGLRFAAFDPAMIDAATAISTLSANMLEDVGAFENTQFSTQRAWLAAVQKNLRTVDAYMSLGTPGASASNSLKDPARAATTTNITLSGTQTVDGVALLAGDRILVKDQTTGSQNGLYVVAAGAWSRSSDANTSALVPSMMIVGVSEGTTNADKLFQLTTNAPITLGSTSLAFTAAAGSGITVGGTAVVGYVPTVTATGPTVLTYQPAASLGLDYTIDFTTSNRDYKAGTGAGSGTAGDNAQTNPFTITANNGTTLPSTLSGGLVLTPRNTAISGVVLASTSSGLRLAGNSTGGGANPIGVSFSLAHLGIDRARRFSIWWLLTSSNYALTTNSEMESMLNSASAASTLLVCHRLNASGTTRSNILGYFNGVLAANMSPCTTAFADINVARFGMLTAEHFSKASSGGVFPASASLATMNRRGLVDLSPQAQASSAGKIFPNDDDILILQTRADTSNADATYSRMRVVQDTP